MKRRASVLACVAAIGWLAASDLWAQTAPAVKPAEPQVVKLLEGLGAKVQLDQQGKISLIEAIDYAWTLIKARVAEAA